jgi:hypothetical protein
MQQSPSKWQKPLGLTVISGRELPEYLGRLPIGEVWGIGPQTSRYLAQFGIRTALDFAAKDAAWVKQPPPLEAVSRHLAGAAGRSGAAVGAGAEDRLPVGEEDRQRFETERESRRNRR